MQGQLHTYTVASLQHALFTTGEIEVRAAPFYTGFSGQRGEKLR